MNKIRKDWAVMIALAAVSLLVVLNFSAILTGISEFFGMMFPLILGMILAFVLNVPMKRIEQVLEKMNFPQKLRRSAAIVSILLILFLIISLLVWIIAPHKYWLLRFLAIGISTYLRVVRLLFLLFARL